MYDEAEFFGLSADRKRDHIFQVCGGNTEISRDQIYGRIQLPDDIEDDSEEGAIFAQWKEKVAEVWDDSLSFLENFNHVLAFLKESVNQLQQDKLSAKKAAQRLVELKNEYGEDLGRLNVKEMDEKIAGIEAKLRDINAEIATAEERIRAISALETEISDLLGKIRAIEPMSDDQKKRLEELPGLVKLAKEEQADIEAQRAADTAEIQRLQEKIREMHGELTAGNERLNIAEGLQSKIEDLSKKIDTFQPLSSGDKKKLEELPAAIRTAREQLTFLMVEAKVAGKCPVGRDDCEYLKESRDKSDKVRAEIKRRQEKIAGMEEDLEKLQDLGEQDQERSRLVQQLGELKQQL